MKTITYKPAALKALRKMPRPDSKRIMAKVAQYADDPAALANNVKALKGRDGIRLRVGDWRVIIDDQGEVLDVLKIGPRGGVYD
ncbi:type II toxin-antitoxin system RelE family toxin [Salipiger abyssi]|uniref:mRNA interferase RelE/StbE n=1 Tax=Salipiger abyssi TaxID=1250539 RepID=A0A1P8UWI6_9RHOB|nr:type II toxin-antitoxin system RelE/ParE family toxin [Salipiger abyssi]APZ53752.1 mRNA interferase RelE/StbE [Salipiger abyssi]